METKSQETRGRDPAERLQVLVVSEVTRAEQNAKTQGLNGQRVFGGLAYKRCEIRVPITYA